MHRFVTGFLTSTIGMDTKKNRSVSSNYTEFCHFDCLPPELLSYIFNFLPYKDLKSARLVCNAWYEASLDPKLTDQDKCVLRVSREAGPLSYGIPLERIRRLRDSRRNFYHFEILGNTVAWCAVQFFSLYGQKIKSLTLWPSVESENDFFNSMVHCHNLKSLSIRIEKICFRLDRVSDSTQWTYPDFPQLETLELTGLRNENFGFLHVMISNAPKLKSVNIKAILLGDSSCLDIIDYLQQFKDRVFDLSMALLTDRYVNITVAENLDKQVALNVRVCQLYTKTLPKSLDTWCQSVLKELELSKAVDVTDELMASICSNCINLEKFISGNFREVKTSITMMSSLKKLKVLTLRDCFALENDRLLKGLCSEVNTTLKEADFSFMAEASSKFFVEFARTHPAVINLSFMFCDCLDDIAVQAIFKYQTSVQDLRLPCCHRVTDIGLNGTLMDVPWSTLEIENPTGHSIARLKDLESLELRNVWVTLNVFDTGVKFPHLRYVGLGYTEISLKTFKRLVENHPTLKDIDVAHLPVSSDFLKYIVKKLPHLVNIAIDESTKVSKSRSQFLGERGISSCRRPWR